jgi:hypothetical protein
MMQLNKNESLYEVKRWLLEQLGIATPVKWQALDLQACAAGARVLSLRQVNTQHRAKCVKRTVCLM